MQESNRMYCNGDESRDAVEGARARTPQRLPGLNRRSALTAEGRSPALPPLPEQDEIKQ